MTLSRLHARELRIAAVEGFRQTAARDEHGIAGLVARILGRTHDAREIDAADQRIAAQDSARAGGRERVLVVDAGVLHVDHDFAGRQRVEREVFETRGDLAVGLVDAECLEGSHSRALRSDEVSIVP